MTVIKFRLVLSFAVFISWGFTFLFSGTLQSQCLSCGGSQITVGVSADTWDPLWDSFIINVGGAAPGWGYPHPEDGLVDDAAWTSSISVSEGQNFPFEFDGSPTLAPGFPYHTTVGIRVNSAYDLLLDGVVQTTNEADACDRIYYWGVGDWETDPNEPMEILGPNGVLDPGQHILTVRSHAVVPAGTCNPQLHSIHLPFGLGSLPGGASAGCIYINQNSLTSSSYGPAQLTCIAQTGESIIPDANSSVPTIRQVWAPQCVADIVPLAGNPSSGYEIRYYFPSQVNGTDGPSGLSVFVGSPFVTWRIQNPDAASNVYKRLDLTEIRGAVTTINEYTYNSGTWSLSTGGSSSSSFVRTETEATEMGSTSEINPDNSQVTQSVVTNIVSAYGSSIPTRFVSHYYNHYAWGDGEVRTDVGFNNDVQTTYRTFDSAGNLIQTTNPDGSFDVSGLGPFMNSPADAVSAQTQTNTGWYRDPKGLYEQINGQTVRYSYQSNTAATYIAYVPTADAIDVQTTQDYFGGTQDAQQNYLITKTGSYSAYCVSPWTSQPAYTQYPDGRLDTWTYEPGTFDGSFHYSLGGIALRKTLTHGTTGAPNGLAGYSTQERSTYDYQGHLVLEETLVMPQGASAFVVTSSTTHAYDAVGNLTNSVLNGRVVYSATWEGNRKTSETDEQGVITTYSDFDGLGRALTVTKTGVPANGGYAAQSDIPTSLVVDVNGQTLRQTVGATGEQQLVQSSTCNTAGLLVSQTSSGVTTNYTYSNGGRTVTQQIGSAGPTTITDHYLDGRVKCISGSGVVAKAYIYGVETNNNDITGDKAGYQWTMEYIGTSDPASPSSRYTKTVTDWLGRTTRIEKPAFGGGTSNTRYYYNDKGQLAKMTQPGMADTIYTYDVMGNQTASGLDMDGNGSLDNSGSSTDRFTTTETIYQTIYGSVCRVTTNTVHGDSPATTIQTEQLTGLPTNMTAAVATSGPNGASVSTTVIDATNKLVTTTTSVPGATNPATQISYNGLLVAMTSPAGTTPAVFNYDALGRQIQSTDPSTRATTVTTYDDVYGQLASTNTTGADRALNSWTVNTYYGASSVNPGQLLSSETDGMIANYTYNARNQVASVSGNTYPLSYSYDTYGALHTLTTTGAAGAAVTTWVYDAATGLLQQKLDNSQHGPSYTYWPSGRIKTRTWARGTTTSYFYDKGGSVNDIRYSDNTTPEVIITNNRLGKPATVVDAAGTHTLTYKVDGQFAGDSTGGSGPLAGTNVSIGYDGFLRRNSLTASNGSNSLLGQGYGYDSATGNMSSVTDDATNGLSTPHNAVTYAYQANSTRLATTTFKHDGTLRLTTVRAPDGLGRLSSITNAAGSTVMSSHTYTYNGHGQRSKAVREDGSYWNYGYNGNGELIDGHHYTSGGTQMAGQQFHYDFDGIGNRTNTTTNGRSAAYTPNKLNQYVSRQVPGAVDVIGTASPSATVTVNSLTVDSADASGYFYKGLTVNNANAPVNQSVDVLAFKGGAGLGGADVVSETQGNVFVPQTPEQFTYDLDGNLTQDGRWTYTWDGENRLVGMTFRGPFTTAGVRSLAFAYDWQDRRISKTVITRPADPLPGQVGSNIITTLQTRFLYDGWNLVAELGITGSPVRTYTWGLDLMGSLQSAGGVGGLLVLNDHTGSNVQPYFACYDGNGSVDALVQTNDYLIGAKYAYGSVGEMLQVTGNGTARGNPIRWSSRYIDDETNLIYYGFRYYTAGIGRWLSEDPLQEEGGLNLYDYTNNSPVNYVDYFGLTLDAAPDASSLPGNPWDKANLQYKGSLSEADPGWMFDIASPFQKSGPCPNGVKIKGKLTPVIHIGDPNGYDRKMNSPIQHERILEGIWAKHWNDDKRAVDPFEGCYCESECQRLAIQIAKAQNNLDEALGAIEAGNQDMYMNGNPTTSDQLAAWQKETNIVNEAMRRSERDRDTLKQLRKKFDQHPCKQCNPRATAP